MKSTILISRIVRVIETEGAVGEGAALAEEYAEAVRKVNQRLEAVQASIDAKQVSDAVRMLEDAPRLLDEIGVLDFNQLPDWEALCARNNWTPPPQFDKDLLERVLMLNESTEVVEPFLRMYRKAVRTNNNRLAVQSLRRLVQIDHSQNWKVNLVQAEEAIQKQLVADFRAAKSVGDKDSVERLAQEFTETTWSEPPTSKGVEEIREYIAEEEAKRRNIEGTEDLSILKRCINENWNRQLAFSMLQAVDGLTEKGWVLPTDDRDIVDSCRQRCADEMEAEEKESRWKELCENLHAAIQQENTSAIRNVLAAPEFLDREPDPDLIKQAQLVIRHEEANRKRKATQIAVCSMFGLLAILGVSGWWLRQKLFNDRCEGEAVKLAALQKGAHAVDRLTEALRRLQEDDPDVYADPRVNVYDGKLKTMRAQMNSRTNEIGTIIAELRALRDAQWGDGVESVTSRIERVDDLLTKDDDVFRSEFLKLKSAWADHCEEVATANRNTASTSHETLVANLNAVAEQLKTQLISEKLEKKVSSCKASVEKWKRDYSQHAPALEGEVDAAEKALTEAENMQCNLREAIARLKGSKSAEEYLKIRKELIEFYAGYPFVKAIGEHPATAEEAAAVVARMLPEQKVFENELKSGVDDAAFATFLTDSVASLAEIPSYFSLYGVYLQGGNRETYFCVSKGKPQIKKPSYGDNYLIDGELLDFDKGEMVPQISPKVNRGKLACYALEPSDEIKNVVDLALRPNISQSKFEAEILKLIDGHLKIAAQKDFLKDEIDVYGKQYSYVRGRYPAIRRVQLIQLYLTWLKDELKLVPTVGTFSRWFDKIDELAQPVRIDNVPEDLTWTCMKETRVRDRNEECARLLHKMATNKFVERYRAWRSARFAMRRLTGWEIEYAGCVAYDPYNQRWMQNRKIVIPATLAGVKRDHPLYVLRRENEKLVLKRALDPSKDGTRWVFARGRTEADFVPGDPLFQISEQGKYIDPESEIDAIFKEIPESRAFAAKIPLFNLGAK